MRTVLLWCVVWMCFCCACEDEEGSPIVILVTPGQQVLDVKAGDKVIYTVETFANSGVIEHLGISSIDAEQGLIRLMDTSLNVARAKFDFQYIVPVMPEDSARINLKFESGNSHDYMSSVRTLRVVGGDVLLQEESGYTLYSSTSSKADAFRISDSQLLFSGQEADSLLDIYDYHDLQEAAGTLSREWRSGSGVRFVRFNDFNYPLATESGIRKAYEEGIKYSSIRNIDADDIILVGRDGAALGVIKIMSVFDEDGTEADRYVFNLKKIVR